MQTKSKLLLIVSIMLLGITAATIVNVSLNFRDYSIKSAMEKSNLAANIVKDGLTAHMINGMMDQREYFLDQISRNNEIDSLWVARSQNVVKQYGEGFKNETVRDAIDKEVLTTGKTIKKITENAEKIILRVTIPYQATNAANYPNCLQCHDVKIGDTLGVISMEFNISAMRNSGLVTILKILGINLLFIIVVLFLINRYISPYMRLFSNLQDGIKKAYSGDFTHEFETTVGGDAKNVVLQMNTLFHKMQETFGDIKYNLSTFIPQGAAVSSADPLHEAKTIINELSDIYKFKKTIELDGSKDMVYSRIVDILRLKYHVKDFTFYEINNINAKRILIHTSKDTICHKFVDKDAEQCRAYRTKSDVISTDFVNLCQSCDAPDDLKYICIPFSVNEDSSLLISITTESDDEINDINCVIPSIKNYLEAAKPVIESRILMDKLRDTSLRDGMTDLYNRRFLEEFIDQVMSQANRLEDTYSVMMIDVDFFKMVNDNYGHDIGDKVIVALAKILKENIRDADLAIRYGGEEFLLMLHNPSQEGALKVAQKIHSAFGSMIFNVSPNETIQKSISIGMSKFPVDGDSIWKCIKFADTALYSAKSTGRNKIVEFTSDMHDGENF